MSKSIMDLLKPEVVHLKDGRAELHYEVRPEFTIPGDVVQGGIVAAMLDQTMAFAAKGALSTASLNIDIMRPVKGPTLRVSGGVTRKGRRIIFAEAEVRNADDEIVARGTQTAVPVELDFTFGDEIDGAS
jgi:uncharacterized protein (TIGR00369 family)